MALTRITKGVIKPNENYDTHNINSTGIVTAIGLDVNGNGDISGSLNVGGVLTYEDVTSIDSVGIITAQKDIHVGAGVSVVGIVTAATFKGDGDFVDIDVDGHTNLDNVSIAGVTTFADNKAAYFGTDGDFHINHSGSSLGMLNTTGDSLFRNTGGSLYFDCNQISLRITAGSQTMLNAAPSGVTLYTSNNAKLATTNTGVNISQDLDVDGHTNLDNVSIAGVTTMSSNLKVVGDFTLEDNYPSIFLKDTDSDSDFMIQNQNGTFTIYDSTNNQDRFEITSTGTVRSPHYTLQSQSPSLTFNDTNHDSDYMWQNANGLFKIYDNTNLADRFAVNSSGSVFVYGNELYIGDSIIHNGDANTKIRFPTNDQIQFETNGSTWFHLGSTGAFQFGNNSDTGAKLYIKNSNSDANNTNALALDIQGGWIRIGDAILGNQTYSNGMGIKFHDSAVAHWSAGVISGDFYISNTSNNGNQLFPSSRTDALYLSSGGNAIFSGDITAGGNLYIPKFIYHSGDTDTYFDFGTNTINLAAGGNIGLTILDASVRVTDKLGINGAAPQVPLDVMANGSGYAINIRGRSSDNVGELRFTSNNYGSLYSVIQTGATYLNFQVGSTTNALRIASNGKVTMTSTTNNLRGLSVVAPKTQINFGTTADKGGFLMSENNGQFGLSGGGYWTGSNWVATHTGSAQIRHDGGGAMVFCTNASLTSGNNFTPTERFRIKSDGNVTISNTQTSPTGDFRMLTMIARSDKQASIGFAQASGVYSGATATGGYTVRLATDAALELATHNSNIIALKATQTGNVEMVGDLSTNNLSGRNIVINGDMRVAQRATSANFDDHGNDIEVCDRWNYNRHGVTATCAQVADAPAGSGFKYSLKWTSTSAVGSLHAGNNLKWLYQIERQDIQRLGYGASGAKKATLSFWAKGSLAGKIGVSCVRDSRIFSANVDMTANTWEFHQVVIPADTSTGFSANDHDNGFQFGICWGGGSNSTSGTTGGNWINYHNAYTAGFTAGQQGAYLTTNGSTFYITGVQLEIGSQATPFEHRSYGDSLMDCYRYYTKIFTNTSDFPLGVGYKYGTTTHAVSVQLPTRLRSTPTCTFDNLRIRGGNLGGANNAETVTSVSGMSYSNSNFQSFTANTNVNSAAVGQTTVLTNSVSNNTSYIAFDAEL